MKPTKAEQREQQKSARDNKQIKHGIWKWTPQEGISKQRKKIIKSKIKINDSNRSKKK